MSKKSHLDPGRVIALSSDAVHSKKRLFEFAATALRDAFKLDAETVYKALLSREKLGSTAFGGGIAIPHCRIPECTDAAGCLITLGEGIDFNAPDSLPVDVAFVLLVPTQATEQHLNILAQLASAFSQPDLRLALLSAQSGDEAWTVLAERMIL